MDEMDSDSGATDSDGGSFEERLQYMEEKKADFELKSSEYQRAREAYEEAKRETLLHSKSRSERASALLAFSAGIGTVVAVLVSIIVNVASDAVVTNFQAAISGISVFTIVALLSVVLTLIAGLTLRFATVRWRRKLRK